MDDVKRGDMETAMRMVCNQCTVPRQRPEPIARAVNPILAGGAVRSRLADGAAYVTGIPALRHGLPPPVGTARP